MKDISKLTFFYVKKLFNFKNIVFFLIIFLCIYTLFHTFQAINNYENQGSDSDHITNILRDNWLTRILFIGIFVNFSTTYSYIYLKKNNYTNTTNLKNSLCNFIIIFAMIFISYFAISLFVFIDYNSYNVVHSFGYDENMRLLIDMFLFNLITLMFISLFNVKNKYGYLYASFVFVMSLIFFLNVLERALWMKKGDLANFYTKIIIFESSILFVLLLANFVKRTPKIMDKFSKNASINSNKKNEKV